MSPTWDEDDKGSMDVMAEAKQKKILRSVGMSCHSVEAMKVASKNPWLDVCMVRLNPAGERMDDEPGVGPADCQRGESQRQRHHRHQSPWRRQLD